MPNSNLAMSGNIRDRYIHWLVKYFPNATRIDIPCRGLIIENMAKPEAAHRMKSYSSETGYVYQYYFYEAQKSRRGFATGREYVYMVSADRKTTFPITVFIGHDAVQKWNQAAGRALTGTEEYAAAKMRLFQGFDEVEDFATSRPELTVDDSNLSGLPTKLDI